MELIEFAQLGVAGVAIIAMAFLVKAFLGHLTKRDKDLNDLFSNHLTHNTSVLNKLKETQSKLTETIEMLTRWLKNGRK